MVDLVAANRPRLAGSVEDARAAAAACNGFGFDLYRRLALELPAANLVMSPASVALAIAMARPGARGTTADEIDRVLHGFGDVGTGVAALDAALRSRTGSFTDWNGERQEVTLRIANAPFGQRGYRLDQTYLDALAERFDGGLRLVDYLADPEVARRQINGWVEEQTERRIPDLLGQGDVDTRTRLVLVNAIYLKAAWQTQFHGSATRPATFRRIDGSTVEVPMMHATEYVAHAEGAGWRAVELPYVGGQLSMIVIVPDDLDRFDAEVSNDALAGIAEALAGGQVALGLPRFSIETRQELGRRLAALGMRTAFTDSADFSGITTAEPLQISAVVHQANIDVDENGTEAAAATAVAIRATGMPAEPVPFVVDRPFVFVLRDRETGAVLFLGRVTEPGAAGA